MAEDKILHMTAGMLITLCWYVYEAFIGEYRMRLGSALLTALVVAAGKEVYDYVDYGGAGMIEAMLDILATVSMPLIMYVAFNTFRCWSKDG